MKELNWSKSVRWGVTIAILIVFVLIIVYFSKWLRRFFGFSNAAADFNWEATPYVESGGDVDAAFAIDSYVSDLVDVLGKWLFDGSPRCQAYKRLMELNDNEFIAVLNAYYAATGNTLRGDMNGTFQSGCTIFGTQWDDKVYKRMKRLNTI